MTDSFTINCMMRPVDQEAADQLRHYCSQYGIMNMLVKRGGGRVSLTFLNTGNQSAYDGLMGHAKHYYDELNK